MAWRNGNFHAKAWARRLREEVDVGILNLALYCCAHLCALCGGRFELWEDRMQACGIDWPDGVLLDRSWVW